MCRSTNLNVVLNAVEHNYRFYQFYGNAAVANLFFAVCHQFAYGLWPWPIVLGFFIVEGILFIASRDSLTRFYERVELILGTQ